MTTAESNHIKIFLLLSNSHVGKEIRRITHKQACQFSSYSQLSITGVRLYSHYVVSRLGYICHSSSVIFTFAQDISVVCSMEHY